MKRLLIDTVRALVRGLYRLSSFFLAKGPHVTRYALYRQIETYHQPRSADDKVLSISHSEQIAELMGYRRSQIEDAAYPDYNILDLPFDDASFDAVVSDQVLEHVEGNPQAAIDETMRVLKPGGLALHTTCFINPVHGFPSDFWRFTPQALQLLTEPHGKILDMGGWGNPLVWPFAAIGLRSEGIPHLRWHPAHWVATRNTQTWPVVTWVLVQKN